MEQDEENKTPIVRSDGVVPESQQPVSSEPEQGSPRPQPTEMLGKGQSTEDAAGVSNASVTAGAPSNPESAQDVVERGVANVREGASVKETGKPKMTYEELYQAMTPYKPPTTEELERERRKEKRKALFSALGDGLTALSNLYFTTQYAPSMNIGETMSGRTRARFDQLKKEREAKNREYMEGFMRAMRMDADDAITERNWRHTLEREKINDRYRESADARAEAKADRDAALSELRMLLMQGKIDEQEADTRRAQVEAEYQEALSQSQINKNNRANRGRGGGGGKRYESKWYDEYGDEQTEYGTSQSAADRAAELRSREAGTWREDYVTSETETERFDRTGRSAGTSTSSTTRVKGGHSEKPKNPKPKPTQQSQPAQSQPTQQKQPAQSQPAQSQPAQSQPAQKQPTQSQQPAQQGQQSGKKRWSNASQISYK